MMGYSDLICFWLGFGIAAWAFTKHARHPDYFKAKLQGWLRR